MSKENLWPSQHVGGTQTCCCSIGLPAGDFFLFVCSFFNYPESRVPSLSSRVEMEQGAPQRQEEEEEWKVFRRLIWSCLCVSGFIGDYPYPHAHTLYFQEADAGHKLQPEQFRAKMLMFTFGNALARAHKLYGVRSHRSQRKSNG